MACQRRVLVPSNPGTILFLQDILNFLVIHLHICFFQFSRTANEIISIVWVDWSDISWPCNQSPKSQNKGISVQGTGDFNVYCHVGHASKCSILLNCTPSLFNCKRSKYVHTTVGEWCCFLWSAGRKICDLLLPYSCSKPWALYTVEVHLPYCRIGSNYPVSNSSYFI